VRRSRSLWVLAAALVLTLLVRAPLLTHQGLWVDEIFSLALATGHSLEQPAAESDAALGDFVQGEAPRPAAEWRAYLRHDEVPAGPARVLRAVRLSDTSPPLYYLVLWAWTRVLGTSDAALRSLSLACALLCVPLVARLARRAGGRAAVAPACLLYALAPLSVYYGTEGRMYALLWLELLAFVELTLAQRARGSSPLRLASWCAAAAAGFLTHYFFAFVWAAVLAYAWFRPRRLRRGVLLAGVALTALAILPWYAHLGESLGAWRVTMDWLKWKPSGFSRPTAVLELFVGFFTGSAENLWGEHVLARGASLVLFALLFFALLRRRRERAIGGRRLVPWLWFGAAWAGPLVFDALLGTYTVAVERYALGGLPAAMLLAAVALAELSPRLRAAWLVAVVCAWAPHLEMLARRPERAWCPLRELANGLERNSTADDLVLVHSIPSGVLGLARYYDGPAPLASWVGQLGQRAVPESLLSLAHGKHRIHLVRVHEVGAVATEEEWLRSNARLVADGKRDAATICRFEPAAGATTF